MSEYIVCPHNNAHDRNVPYSVLCGRCHRPLFKVRWWYHAAFLNLVLFTVGFIIGEYQNVWIPGLLIDLLFLIYVCIVFRKDQDDLTHTIWLFTLSLNVAFLMAYGDLDYVALALIRAVLPYVLVTVLLGYYLVYWLNEIENPFMFIKGFPVLTLGLFLFLLVVDWANELSPFLDERIATAIKSHIHLRWILLGLTSGWLIVYAFIKSLGKEINPRREFLDPFTHVEYWPDETLDNSFWDTAKLLIKPVVNITLNIYVTITQALKAVLNFAIYLLHLILLWLREFLLQCLEVTKETLKLFSRVLINFLHNAVIPLGFLVAMHYVLLVIPKGLSNQIYAIEGSVGVFGVIVNLGVFVLFSLGLILTVGKFESEQVGDVAGSIMVTNVAVGLMILLYTWVTSILLWVVAQWLTESPFQTIGPFPFLVGGTALLIGLAIFVYEKFKRESR